MAYFKHIAKHDHFLKGTLKFQRTKNINTDYLDYKKMDKEVPLRSASIYSVENKKIEDYAT